MTEPQQDNVCSWLAEPMSKDVAQTIDRLAELKGVDRIAVMPDVHLAKQVCVGLVVASRREIYPAAVGSDIGCGMAAIRMHGGRRNPGRRAIGRESPCRAISKSSTAQAWPGHRACEFSGKSFEIAIEQFSFGKTQVARRPIAIGVAWPRQSFSGISERCRRTALADGSQRLAGNGAGD